MFQPVIKPEPQLGFSLVGILVGVAVAVLMIVAVSLFVGRGFTTSREQLAHVLATEEVRLHLQRMSDTIRNGRNVAGEGTWLISASDHEIRLHTNIDNDLDAEEVRYFLDGTNLMRGITQEGNWEELQVLSRRVRNLEGEGPMFLYFNVVGDWLQTPEEINGTTVRSIVIRLVVDVDPNKLPVKEIVETAVLVRGTLDTEALSPVDLLPVTLDFPADPNSGVTNVKVTVLDPDTGTPLSQEIIPITTLNNEGRVEAYDGGFDTNLNYQAVTVNGKAPGWYAWIGPIPVNPFAALEDGVIDQLPIPELCLGSDLETMLVDDNVCDNRTLTNGGFTLEYKPILSYSVSGGAEHYVRNITFTFTGN